MFLGNWKGKDSARDKRKKDMVTYLTFLEGSLQSALTERGRKQRNSCCPIISLDCYLFSVSWSEQLILQNLDMVGRPRPTVA